MKYYYHLVITACFCLLGAAAWSQSVPSVSDMSIPTSPGLVLGDKAPSSIERPTNPKSLSVSLLNLLQGGAIEFNPYWFSNHPSYTFKNYMDDRFPVLKTLGISGVTFKTDTSSSLAAGLRTQPFRWFSTGRRKTIDDLKGKIQDALVSLPLNLDSLSKLRDAITGYMAKPTIAVEVAGAYLGASASNTYNSLQARKWGAWVNLMWNPGFPLTFTGVARYSRLVGSVPKGLSDSAFFDYGLNVSYSTKKFDVAAEFVERRDVEYQQNYHRFTFTGNFVITDNIILVAALGKNFNKVNNIISVFGVKLGLSKEKVSP